MAEIDLRIPGLTSFEEIGTGGFASVYSAYEGDAGRHVAVKVLRAADDRARERFDRERRTLGMMTEHAHIVTMFRSGFTEHGNHPYLMMEYMPDGSLQDWLNRGERPPVEHVGRLIGQIADALGFAHKAGIVHKDVKPANILLSRNGVAKLTDFGISTVRDATGTSQIGFSLAYAPPETFHAGTAADGRFVDRRDERSDLYSLAATLYALVAGAPPFAAETHATAMHRILTELPRKTGFASLDQFFAIALAKDPADRFQTADHFSSTLRDSLANPGGRSGLQPPSPPLPDAATFIAPAPNGQAGMLAATAGLSAPVAATSPIAPPPPIEQAIPTQGRSRRPMVSAALAAVGLIALTGGSLAVSGAFGRSPTLDSPSTPTLAEPTVAEDAEEEDAEAESMEAEDIEPAGALDSPTTRETDDNTAAPSTSGSSGDITSTTRTTAITEGSSAVKEKEEAEGEGETTGTTATTAIAAVATGSPTLAEEPRVVAVLRRNVRTNSVVALDGGRFASPDFDSGVRIWRRDTPGEDVATYTSHGGGVTVLTELDGGLIASGGTYGDGTIHVWDPAAPNTTIATYTGHQSDRAVTALLQLRNGLIVSGDAGGSVQVWDPADPNATIAAYTGHAGHAGVIITKIIQLSNGLVLSNGEGDGAHVWSATNPGATRAVYSAPGSGPNDTYTYDVVELDGGLIASDTLGGVVHVWSPDRPGTPMATFTGHSDVGALLELTGGLIASGGENGQIHVWDPADPNTRLLTYSGHQGTVYSIIELDNGLLASTASNEVHIWNPYSAGG